MPRPARVLALLLSPPLGLSGGCAADTAGLELSPTRCAEVPSPDVFAGVPLGLSRDGRFLARYDQQVVRVFDRCERTEVALENATLGPVAISDDGERVALLVHDPVTYALFMGVFDREGVSILTVQGAGIARSGPLLSADGSSLALTVQCEDLSLCPRLASLDGAGVTLPRAKEDFAIWLSGSADLRRVIVGGSRQNALWSPSSGGHRYLEGDLSLGYPMPVSDDGASALANVSDALEGVPESTVRRYDLASGRLSSPLGPRGGCPLLLGADGRLRFAVGLSMCGDSAESDPTWLLDLSTGARHDLSSLFPEVGVRSGSAWPLLSRDGRWLAVGVAPPSPEEQTFAVLRNPLAEL